MKILFATILCVIPVVYDLIIARIFWRKRLNHFLSASGRLLLIYLIALLNPTVMPWQSWLLAISFHFLTFPALNNRLILNKEWDYIGTTAVSDRIEQWVRDHFGGPLISLFFRMAFITLGIKFYVSPYIFDY